MNGPAPDKRGGQQEASKTQGTLPGAPKANLAEGVAIDTNTAVGGDKEGAQSMSMVTGK